MIDDLYSTRVLELAANIGRVGSLEAPDGTSRKVSKLCGSWLEADVKLDEDGRIADYTHRLQACALGQAAAAILAENIFGASLDEVRAGRDDLKAMLKEGASPPEGRFSDLYLLQSVKDYPARHTSTLLAFEATLAAMEAALENRHAA